jgi:hypothetical protein
MILVAIAHCDKSARVSGTDSLLRPTFRGPQYSGPEARFDEVRRNLVFDLFMKLRKKGPVNSRALVVGRVVAEIAGQEIVGRTRVIHARVVVARRIVAGMVAIGRIRRVAERDKGRNQKDQDRVHGIQVEESSKHRPKRNLHPQEGAQEARIRAADFKDVDLVIEDEVSRVLDHPHLRTVFPGPLRLVGFRMRALIQVVPVVSQVVVKNPTVRPDPRLHRKRDVIHPIEPRGVKRIEVLMVMINRRHEKA